VFLTEGARPGTRPKMKSIPPFHPPSLPLYPVLLPLLFLFPDPYARHSLLLDLCLAFLVKLRILVTAMARTAKAIFDAGEADGALPVEETGINGDEVHSVLEPGTKSNYDRMIDLSDEYNFPYCKMPRVPTDTALCCGEDILDETMMQTFTI
jgi:hypothetical protein